MQEYNERKPHWIPCAISIVMLLGSFLDWPYGYYQLLRIVVCGSAAFTAFVAHETGKAWGMWLFIGLAVLFNPIAPIHLDRESWTVLDLLTAAIFGVGIAVISRGESGGNKT